MIRSRAKLTWYGSAAFLLALLLAGGPRESGATPTIARRDAPPQTTHSSDPAFRLHVAEDVLRRLDGTWLEPTDRQSFRLFHTTIEIAQPSVVLRRAQSSFRAAHARAPPIAR